ncbi:phBC6A51 family helix-turn-helix protein [Paenibacillus sp. 102]|uniref:phBC6A51 family helix-turn-helix protein n=1 Tax=Paenibacillus sp. 102 TaxID=3120823 RepID=UPI0031BA7F90
MKQRKLTPQQLETLVDVFEKQRSGQTLTAIANDIGVSRRNIYNWRKSEEWIEMERQLKEKLIQDAYYSVMDTLVRRAIEGKSPKFIELYLKTQGKLREQDGVQVNVNNNIVQDGVPDDIFAELDAILQGEY